ncbi:MAG: ARMT1-like domain-containing protein [Planctomycetes bacterium]|nr:ARMT1-like domain-containing protein [Planctomycetota bacterium]
MKPIPDCGPDALSLIIATAKAVSDDDFIHRKVLLKVMGEIAEEGDLGTHPADVYLDAWEIACRSLGVKDPYENKKARGDKAALGILRSLEENPVCCQDPLRNAIRTSLAGAMLDYRGLGRGDMQEKIVEFLQDAPVHDDSELLVKAIDRAQTVMLVANRAGEIVLDKPLAEAIAALGKKVYVVVSAKPIFLMATEKDATNAGFSGDIEVVNPGTAMFGLMQERASSEFRSLLAEVDVVIVKGSTNFSTMAPQRELFFILKASQDEVADRLKVEKDGGVIIRMPAEGE